MEDRAHRRGVTLVELIVALAVFSSLTVTVFAVFLGSMRAIKTGEVTMGAYEEARAALNIIERDLTTCFTSRDRGDYYTFFGTPIGMTFVGLVRSNQWDNAGEPNIARVTYVFHRNTVATFDDVDGQPVTTYSLIRYVENNRQDLDTFDVPWYDDQQLSLLEPGPNGEQRLRDFLDWAPGYFVNSARPDSLTPTEQQLVNAKKRELWIRMLAGGDRVLPDIWAYWDWRARQLDPSISDDGKDPLDYLVADGVVSQWTDSSGAHPAAIELPYSGRPFFQYGRFTGNPDDIMADKGIEFTPYWNSELNAPLDSEDVLGRRRVANEVGSPLTPRLPAVVAMHIPFAFKSPYPGAPDFKREFSQIVDVPTAYTRLALNY